MLLYYELIEFLNNFCLFAQQIKLKFPYICKWKEGFLWGMWIVCQVLMLPCGDIIGPSSLSVGHGAVTHSRYLRFMLSLLNIL